MDIWLGYSDACDGQTTPRLFTSWHRLYTSSQLLFTLSHFSSSIITSLLNIITCRLHVITSHRVSSSCELLCFSCVGIKPTPTWPHANFLLCHAFSKQNTRHVSQTKESIRRPLSANCNTRIENTKNCLAHQTIDTAAPKLLSSFSSWLATQHEPYVSHTNKLFLFSLKHTRQTSRVHVSHTKESTRPPPKFLSLFHNQT